MFWAFEILKSVYIWWGIITLILFLAGVILGIFVDDDWISLCVMAIVSGILWVFIGFIILIVAIVAWAFSLVCGISFGIALAIIIIIWFCFRLVGAVISE